MQKQQKTKYQIAKTKQRRWNTKIITETEHKYQIAEAEYRIVEGNMKY
jgi:hypothetical protein